MSIDDATTDESIAAEKPDSRIRVPLAGGTLVYRELEIGRELIGFEDVVDWDSLQDGLAARGHDRGAIYDLPTLDA